MSTPSSSSSFGGYGGGGGFAGAAAVGGGGPTAGGLLPCAVCSRNFAPDRLAKHQAICRKAASKPRKVFNSTLHRVKGTEMESFVRATGRAGAGAGRAVQPRAGKPQSGGWRQKHEEFIRNIRAAKRAKLYVERGGDIRDLPPPPPDENPHYIPCPHCGRRFAPEAGERHIPRCATTIARPAPPPSIRHPFPSPAHAHAPTSASSTARPRTAAARSFADTASATAPPPPQTHSPRNVSFNSRPHFEGERGFTPAPGARPPALKKRAGTAGASRLRSTHPGPPTQHQLHQQQHQQQQDPYPASPSSRFPTVNPSSPITASLMRPTTATIPSSRPSARSSSQFETSSSAYGAFLGVRSTSGVEASYEQRQAERRAAAELLKADRKRGIMKM